MIDWAKAYVIQYPETFEYRRAVLDAIIPGRWQLSPDGKRIKFDINIDLYSYHEYGTLFFLLETLTTWPSVSFLGSTGQQLSFLLRPSIDCLALRVLYNMGSNY